MQNACSTTAILRASEGYHFSHDALVTWKLPIGRKFLSFHTYNSKNNYVLHLSITLIVRLQPSFLKYLQHDMH